MYDGTRHKVRNVELESIGGPTVAQAVVNGDIDKHEVFVIRAKRAFTIKQVCGDEERFTTITLHQPSILQTAESTKAEAVHEMLKTIEVEEDDLLDAQCARTVDVVVADDHPSNIKEEKKMQEFHPKRSILRFSCDTHKKYKVSSTSVEPAKPIDTRILRLGLACRNLKSQIRREARLVMREQLIIQNGGSCPPEVDAHRRS